MKKIIVIVVLAAAFYVGGMLEGAQFQKGTDVNSYNPTRSVVTETIFNGDI